MPRRRHRRPVSMTSLIDVIFLLLLFFMLSSTFTKFGEVEMQVAQAGAGSDIPSTLLFLRLEESRLTLNGASLALDELAAALEATLSSANADEGSTLVVSVRSDVTAQRMTDLLVTLRTVPEANVVVLGNAS